MNKIYHLIPMDMEECKIDEFCELEKDNGVMWANGPYHPQVFNEGDIVYIYCRNLSDGSNRILFRAVVSAADDKYDNTYSYDENTKAFWIKNIKAFNVNDKQKYSKQSLQEDYKVIMNQTKRILTNLEDLNKYKNNPNDIKCDLYGDTDEESLKKYLLQIKLVQDLENDYNNSIHYSLQEMKNAFNDTILCECCKILGFSNKEAKNRTFMKTNGFIYYEIHHLLMQNILSIKKDEWFKEHSWYDKDNDSNMILDEYNEINLCPVCHREFHYGNFNYKSSNMSKKEIIEELMKKHEFDENLKTVYKKTDSEVKEIKEYIIEQYIKKEDK